MDKISFNIERYTKPKKKRMAAYEFQDRAATVIKMLNVPEEVIVKGKKRKPRSMFFKWFKTNRVKAEACYQYVMAKKPKTPWLYFAWLMTH